ncbi:hypothetical protein ABPG72_016321 [Tetrahymena utriculariae]
MKFNWLVITFQSQKKKSMILSAKLKKKKKHNIRLGLSPNYNTRSIIHEFINQKIFYFQGIQQFKEIKVQIWLKNKVFRLQLNGNFYGESDDWNYKPFEKYFLSIQDFNKKNIYLQNFKEVKNFQVW